MTGVASLLVAAAGGLLRLEVAAIFAAPLIAVLVYF